MEEQHPMLISNNIIKILLQTFHYSNVFWCILNKQEDEGDAMSNLFIQKSSHLESQQAKSLTEKLLT